jgi:excisionase family DNA binding protein
MPKESAARFISLKQASHITEFSTRTLRRAIARKTLRAYRLGRCIRIEVSELERWIRADGNATDASHGVETATPPCGA